MEHQRVRKSLVTRLGAGGSGAPGHVGAMSSSSSGTGATTKRALVRKLERSKSAKQVVAGLQCRQVSRDGTLQRREGSNNNETASFSSRQAHQHLARAASAESLLFPHARSTTPQSATPESSSSTATHHTPRSKVNEDAVRRARQRYKEKFRQRERMQQDLEALREQEAEEERSRQDRRRRTFERERAERAKHLVDWKRSVQASEAQKQRREQRRKAKERRELEQGLKERQERYAAQLKEHERANRHKRPPQTSILPPLSGAPSSASSMAVSSSSARGDGSMAAAVSKMPCDLNSRMRQIKSSYDPSVSSAKHLKAISGSSSTTGRQKSKAPRRAKKMSDTDIVEMARRIVQNVQNGSADPETSRALSQEDLSFLQQPNNIAAADGLTSAFANSPAPDFRSSGNYALTSESDWTTANSTATGPESSADAMEGELYSSKSELDEFTANLIARLDSTPSAHSPQTSVQLEAASFADPDPPSSAASDTHGLADLGDLSSNIEDWYRQQLRIDDA